MGRLTEMPNIGDKLEKKLKEINVNTFEDLKDLGSKEVFLKLKAIDSSACFNMLCALEGAIQRVRWHYLSPDSKKDLKSFYEALK